jgi:hypothetical protein
MTVLVTIIGVVFAAMLAVGGLGILLGRKPQQTAAPLGDSAWTPIAPPAPEAGPTKTYDSGRPLRHSSRPATAHLHAAAQAARHGGTHRWRTTKRS